MANIEQCTTIYGAGHDPPSAKHLRTLLGAVADHRHDEVDVVQQALDRAAKATQKYEFPFPLSRAQVLAFESARVDEEGDDTIIASPPRPHVPAKRKADSPAPTSTEPLDTIVADTAQTAEQRPPDKQRRNGPAFLLTKPPLGRPGEGDAAIARVIPYPYKTTSKRNRDSSYHPLAISPATIKHSFLDAGSGGDFTLARTRLRPSDLGSWLIMLGPAPASSQLASSRRVSFGNWDRPSDKDKASADIRWNDDRLVKFWDAVSGLSTNSNLGHPYSMAHFACAQLPAHIRVTTRGHHALAVRGALSQLEVDGVRWLKDADLLYVDEEGIAILTA